MTTLWDTDGSAIARALTTERELAGGLGGEPSLTLIAMCDEPDADSVRVDGAEAAAHHPCRLLTVVRRDPDSPESRIDAEIGLGGRYGPVESIVLRLSGAATAHADSVVLPLLAAESTVHLLYLQAPPMRLADDPLSPLCERLTTDCSLADNPSEALDARASDYRPGDTDLAWTRLTDLRGLLATTLDACPCAPMSGAVQALDGEPSGRLLRGWLASRLAIPVDLSNTSSPTGIAGTSVAAIALTLADGTQVEVTEGSGQRVSVRNGDRTREVAVPARSRAELLAEELRRAEVDVTYEAALRTAAPVAGEPHP